MGRVWFDRVTKQDARALTRWWNSHTIGYFFWRRSGRFFTVYRG